MSRGGTHYRVCGPDWDDPADTSYSQRYGGRWNAPGMFGALYLNENIEGARANARRFIAAQFGPGVLPEDIDPAYLPDIAAFMVNVISFVDAVTDHGRNALGLAAKYAENDGHTECQAVGARALAAGDDGIATTSAVTEQSEELVVFDRAVARIVHAGPRRRFANWWAPPAPTPLAGRKKKRAPAKRKKRKSSQRKL